MNILPNCIQSVNTCKKHIYCLCRHDSSPSVSAERLILNHVLNVKVHRLPDFICLDAYKHFYGMFSQFFIVMYLRYCVLGVYFRGAQTYWAASAGLFLGRWALIDCLKNSTQNYVNFANSRIFQVLDLWTLTALFQINYCCKTHVDLFSLKAEIQKSSQWCERSILNQFKPPGNYRIKADTNFSFHLRLWQYSDDISA